MWLPVRDMPLCLQQRREEARSMRTGLLAQHHHDLLDLPGVIAHASRHRGGTRDRLARRPWGIAKLWE